MRLSHLNIKKSIQSKIFFSFIIVMVLPTAALSISSYYISVRILKDKVSASYVEAATYIGNSIEKELKQVERLSDYIFANSEIQRSLQTTYTDELEYFNDFKNINEILNEYATGSSIYPFVNSIILLGNNDKYFFLGNMPYYHTDENIKKTWWYDKALKYDGRILWMGVAPTNEKFLTDNKYSVMLSRAIKQGNYGDITGISYISIRNDLFTQILNKTPFTSQNHILIVDNQNKIVYHPDINMISTKYDGIKEMAASANSYFISDKYNPKCLIAYYHIKNYDWWVIEKIPLSELFNENKIIFNVTLVVFILSFIVTAFIWFLVSSSIVNPIKKLTQTMKSVRQGNLKVRFDYPANDEIGVMGGNFNYMLERIESLLEELLEEQAKEKDAEYQALQAQINPHFLYNTFNTIRWMAIIQKADNIREMVEALGRLIRNTTRKMDQFITIEEEIKNLEDYIYIQKIRYKDKFEVMFDVDNRILQYRCIKFILQPLVENAIFHGIEPKDSHGFIMVTARLKEKDIEFFVKDNGVGMTKTQIDNVMSGTKKRDGFNAIGIKNINDRVKIAYGDKYGIKIESEPGCYTSIVLTIPVKDGDSNV